MGPRIEVITDKEPCTQCLRHQRWKIPPALWETVEATGKSRLKPAQVWGSGLRLPNLSPARPWRDRHLNSSRVVRLAGMSECTVDHTGLPLLAWAVPACNSTTESLLGSPLSPPLNPHLRGCQVLDPHPQDIAAPTQRSLLWGPAPSWRSHQRPWEQAVLRARKEAVQEGDGDGRGPFLHRRARAVICWIYTVIHLS